MTRREVERILRVWQRRLALERWEIELVVDVERWVDTAGDASTSDAEVHHPRCYQSAEVFVNPGTIGEWDRRRATGVIVHELLHLKLRELEHVADLVETHVHRDVWAVVTKHRTDVLEATVDELADRLAELELELTPTPKRRRRRKPAPAAKGRGGRSSGRPDAGTAGG